MLENSSFMYNACKCKWINWSLRSSEQRSGSFFDEFYSYVFEKRFDLMNQFVIKYRFSIARKLYALNEKICILINCCLPFEMSHHVSWLKHAMFFTGQMF